MIFSFNTHSYCKRTLAIAAASALVFGGGLLYSLYKSDELGIVLSLLFLVGNLYQALDAIITRASISISDEICLVVLNGKEKNYGVEEVLGVKDHLYNGFYILFKDGTKFRITTKFEMINTDVQSVELLNKMTGIGRWRVVHFIKYLLNEKLRS